MQRRTIGSDAFERLDEQLLPVFDQSKQPGRIVQGIELVDVFVRILLCQRLEAGRVQVRQMLSEGAGASKCFLRDTHSQKIGIVTTSGMRRLSTQFQV